MQLRMRNAVQPDLCPHCGALFFEEECFSASWCCKDGELDAMYRLRPLPPELVDMWVAEAKVPVNLRLLRRHSRLVNAYFALSTLHTTGFVESEGLNVNNDWDRFVFKVHGICHTHIPPNVRETFLSYIRDGVSPKFPYAMQAQLLVPRLGALRDILVEYNPVASQLRNWGEEHCMDHAVVIRRPGTATEAQNPREISLILAAPHTRLQPRTMDIVINPQSRDRRGKQGENWRLSVLDSRADALQYPLIHVHGELGWGLDRPSDAATADQDAASESSDADDGCDDVHGAQQGDGQGEEEEDVMQNSTVFRYYRYRMVAAERLPETSLDSEWVEVVGSLQDTRDCYGEDTVEGFMPVQRRAMVASNRVLYCPNARPECGPDNCILLPLNRLHMFQQVGQQLLVDGFSKMLDSKMEYQRRARAKDELYLSSHFFGSPRFLREKTENGLKLVAEKGFPLFFITVTCNANWEEFSKVLPFGQFAEDAPMWGARIFRAKMKKFMASMLDGSLFPNCTEGERYQYSLRGGAGQKGYDMSVIEFQKLGLPHSHIVFRPWNTSAYLAKIKAGDLS